MALCALGRVTKWGSIIQWSGSLSQPQGPWDSVNASPSLCCHLVSLPSTWGYSSARCPMARVGTGGWQGHFQHKFFDSVVPLIHGNPSPSSQGQQDSGKGEIWVQFHAGPELPTALVVGRLFLTKTPKTSVGALDFRAVGKIAAPEVPKGGSDGEGSQIWGLMCD